MEQASEITLRERNRGAMNAVTMQQLQGFVDQWIDAGGHVVQHWNRWESEAAQFFGLKLTKERKLSLEVMHGVMAIVIGISQGTLTQVKAVMRSATPSALELAASLLSHIPQYASVIEAEQRYRAMKLASDWSLVPDDLGRVIVRTEFRTPSGETEH